MSRALVRMLCSLSVALSSLGCSSHSEPDEAQEPPHACPVQWGAIGLPSAQGTLAMRYFGDGSPPAEPALNATPDTVQATTYDGRKLPCSKSLGGYECRVEAGKLKTITVTMAGQSWSWAATCSPYAEEDGVRFDLEDAKPCVAAGSTVVEGELLDYDETRPTPVVTLEGPWQKFLTSSGASRISESGYIPGVRCEVKDGYYRCPTLGFRASTTHTVVAGGVRTEVSLPVERCKAESVQLDVACTSEPAGMYIETPTPESDRDHDDEGSGLPHFMLRAAYEDGPSYPCRLASEAPYGASVARHVERGPATVYFCEAAPGDAYGRGRYEIVASYVSGSGPAYRASVSDAFDGCGGFAGPLEWRKDSP
jgi:hypothetical protein